MYKSIRCPRCEGKRTLPTNKQGGLCFECGGSGQLRVREAQYNAWKKKEDARRKLEKDESSLRT